MKYHSNDQKTLEERLFDTRFEGKVISVGDTAAFIELLNDNECFLVVPRQRLPKVSQTEGARVRVFLTTKYGHFGILPIVDEENL